MREAPPPEALRRASVLAKALVKIISGIGLFLFRLVQKSEVPLNYLLRVKAKGLGIAF
jgi:hypothetical protein